MGVNAQYNVAAAGSLAVRIAAAQRRKMFAAFMSLSPAQSDSILDVGVTSDTNYSHSNYLEAWLANKSRITAVGLDDASFLEAMYPGLTYLRADGRALPFADRAFDFVHSSAVLEHVGNRSDQVAMVRELWRVARQGIFLTTPNRWFPVEFHTMLPLLHWLPPAAFRAILARIGHRFLAEESNLNLVTARALHQMAREAGLDDARVTSVSLLGWPTNLLLSGRRG